MPAASCEIVYSPNTLVHYSPGWLWCSTDFCTFRPRDMAWLQAAGSFEPQILLSRNVKLCSNPFLRLVYPRPCPRPHYLVSCPFPSSSPPPPPTTLLSALSRARFCLSPPSPPSSRPYPTARISPVPPGRQCSHHPITDYPRLGEPTSSCIGNVVGRVVVALVPAGTPCFCHGFVLSQQGPPVSVIVSSRTK